MDVLPVRSEEAALQPAVVNVSIVGLNIVVFLLELLFGDAFIERWAFVPAQLTAFFNGTGSFHAVLTVFSAMFMHAGLAHLLSNMIFLWVFGQAVEAAFGGGTYLLFYLVCGVVASFAQWYADPTSTAANLGASGAIAGVMGAYLAMYPTSMISLYVWPLSLIFWRDFRVPAWLLLGLWFLGQLVSGVSGVSSTTSSAGGVAFWAHVGGFVTGFVLALVVRPGRRFAEVPS